ncbi:MAG TPA: hypothetical protein DET40_04555 [Lentisphaeria bacterium]|nr:MAG: hypothetical protein A2X45_21565 [Lentisphaerae bacterium GWF2_50_93]HCE42797.1 hypothetical protein [Lentisphaeria bacterium]
MSRSNIIFFILPFLSAFLLISSSKAAEQNFSSPEKLVTLKNGGTSSCGFIAKQDGKTYVFTSLHAIGMGGSTILKKDGKPVKTTQVEIASDRDIVRFSIDDQTMPAFDFGDILKMDEPCTVVTTSLNPEKNVTDMKISSGPVAGVGSAFFNIASSEKNPYMLAGSPVISKDGKVLGVVSADIPSLMKVPMAVKDVKVGKKQKQKPKSKSAPEFNYSIDWGGTVCTRISNDTKWISVKPQELTATARTLSDSRNFINGYLPVLSVWLLNPYAQINAGDDTLPDIRPWLDEHNKKTENNAKYISNIREDANHFQEQARQMQDSARSDGVRFSAFSSSRSTAIRNSKLSPYMEFYSSEMAKMFDEICQIISARYSTLSYIYPDDLVTNDSKN